VELRRDSGEGAETPRGSVEGNGAPRAPGSVRCWISGGDELQATKLKSAMISGGDAVIDGVVGRKGRRHRWLRRAILSRSKVVDEVAEGGDDESGDEGGDEEEGGDGDDEAGVVRDEGSEEGRWNSGIGGGAMAVAWLAGV